MMMSRVVQLLLATRAVDGLSTSISSTVTRGGSKSARSELLELLRPSASEMRRASAGNWSPISWTS